MPQRSLLDIRGYQLCRECEWKSTTAYLGCSARCCSTAANACKAPSASWLLPPGRTPAVNARSVESRRGPAPECSARLNLFVSGLRLLFLTYPVDRSYRRWRRAGCAALASMGQALLRGPSAGAALIGLARDEGVKRNQGRTGARLARQHCARRWPTWRVHGRAPLYDAGDVSCTDSNLKARSRFTLTNVSYLLNQGHLPLKVRRPEIVFASLQRPCRPSARPPSMRGSAFST